MTTNKFKIIAIAVVCAIATVNVITTITEMQW
jgi:hypothetical protein